MSSVGIARMVYVEYMLIRPYSRSFSDILYIFQSPSVVNLDDRFDDVTEAGSFVWILVPA